MAPLVVEFRNITACCRRIPPTRSPTLYRHSGIESGASSFSVQQAETSADTGNVQKADAASNTRAVPRQPTSWVPASTTEELAA